jgi:arginine decarboxylase
MTKEGDRMATDAKKKSSGSRKAGRDARPNPLAGSLSQHFNASQLRLDTWNRLKEAARSLEEGSSGRLLESSSSTERLREVIEESLDTLEPIEVYWAFPGKDAVRHIRELYDKRETQTLASTVTYVVRMLGSDLYRANPAARAASSIDQRGSEAYFQRFDRYRSSQTDKPYFEVLFVDELNPTEEQGLRRRMLEMVGKDDPFLFDLVFRPSFEDAVIAVRLNPNSQSGIIRNTFPLRSPNSLEVLQPYLDAIPDFSLDPEDNATMGVALGRLIKKLRPELDLFMVIDAAAEDIATIVHDDFRRVFGDENGVAHRCLACDSRFRIQAGSATGADIDLPDPKDQPNRNRGPRVDARPDGGERR